MLPVIAALALIGTALALDEESPKVETKGETKTPRAHLSKEDFLARMAAGKAAKGKKVESPSEPEAE